MLDFVEFLPYKMSTDKMFKTSVIVIHYCAGSRRINAHPDVRVYLLPSCTLLSHFPSRQLPHFLSIAPCNPARTCWESCGLPFGSGGELLPARKISLLAI